MDKAQSTISWSKCSECTVHKHFCGTKCALFFLIILVGAECVCSHSALLWNEVFTIFVIFPSLQKNKFWKQNIWGNPSCPLGCNFLELFLKKNILGLWVKKIISDPSPLAPSRRVQIVDKGYKYFGYLSHFESWVKQFIQISCRII